MNGADAHAARQVQYLREQRPGLSPQPRVWRDAQFAQPRVQGAVVQGHPFAERGIEADRHLGRGRLGEGQALDARRVRAAEHQPQQPVGQQLGLARPGAGGDEGGNLRIRRLQLCPGGPIACGGAHATSSSSAPATDHSATRASWK